MLITIGRTNKKADKNIANRYGHPRSARTHSRRLRPPCKLQFHSEAEKPSHGYLLHHAWLRSEKSILYVRYPYVNCRAIFLSTLRRIRLSRFRSPEVPDAATRTRRPQARWRQGLSGFRASANLQCTVGRNAQYVRYAFENHHVIEAISFVEVQAEFTFFTNFAVRNETKSLHETSG